MTDDEKKLLDDFFSEDAYAELKRAAAYYLRSSRGISPTTVVHEVYQRFSSTQKLTPESNLHLKRMLILATRQIIVDKARQRLARKRGEGPVVLTLSHALNAAAPTALGCLEEDAALDKLAEQYPRAAEAFKYKLYGECTQSEIAELLAISEDSVGRDLKLARAFLIKYLGLAANQRNSRSH